MDVLLIFDMNDLNIALVLDVKPFIFAIELFPATSGLLSFSKEYTHH